MGDSGVSYFRAGSWCSKDCVAVRKRKVGLVAGSEGAERLSGGWRSRSN